MIGETFSEIFRKVFEFFETFWREIRSFRSFEFLPQNRSRRDDLFGPKIIEIGAILVIFQPFETSEF